MALIKLRDQPIERLPRRQRGQRQAKLRATVVVDAHMAVQDRVTAGPAAHESVVELNGDREWNLISRPASVEANRVLEQALSPSSRRA
jgi:ABC-type cobalamin/Fe3+-siderophores transport system ATPase subunit